jgi:hypothetical protein
MFSQHTIEDIYLIYQNIFSNGYSYYVALSFVLTIPIITIYYLYGKIRYNYRGKMSEYKCINFHKAVIELNTVKIYKDIVNCNDFNEYIEFINIELIDHKKYIIESVLNEIIKYKRKKSTLSIDLLTYEKDIIYPFLFCCWLDYIYTKNFVEKKIFYLKSNILLSECSIINNFLYNTKYNNIITQNNNSIKNILDENLLLKEHIKYQPDGEKFFDLCESFNNKRNVF